MYDINSAVHVINGLILKGFEISSCLKCFIVILIQYVDFENLADIKYCFPITK